MNLSKKAFTLTELLISVGIITLIGGGVIIAMSRGAANVHRGSFNATASNQAAWIITMMRRDIARSDLNRIKFKPGSGAQWKGNGEFSLLVNGGEKINYSVESRGSGKAFCRSVEGGRKNFLASEYLADLVVEQVNSCFEVSMLLKDPSDKAKDFNWKARIFAPVPAGIDRFWKPLSEIK